MVSSTTLNNAVKDIIAQTSSVKLIKGSTPLLISMPHNGQAIPDDIAKMMTPKGREVADTDWYLNRLYDFAVDLGASIIMPTYSRYVVDLNREPNGVDLYPTENSTELCPTSAFDLSPLYLPEQKPSATEVQRRIECYWQPYHQTLSDTLFAIKAEFGHAILLDAHSILSRVPRFFDGQLPDFNFGTNSGKSCSDELMLAVENVDYTPYSRVTNARFKGGYITRHYGQIDKNIEAIQLELSQHTYMSEQTNEYDPKLAEQVKPKLKALVKCLITFGQKKSDGADDK